MFPPGKDHVTSYLNRQDVRAAIHVTNNHNRYVECAGVYYLFLVCTCGDPYLEHYICL